MGDASIAFVSSDKDSKAWASYFQSMGENWLSLPYDARDQKEKLSKAFGVNGIPSLILLDSEANGRNTVTTSGRSFVMENCVEDFPRSWAPKPYSDLTKTAECKGSSINDEKALRLRAPDGGQERRRAQGFSLQERKDGHAVLLRYGRFWYCRA